MDRVKRGVVAGAVSLQFVACTATYKFVLLPNVYAQKKPGTAFSA
jgi:hypothetical protein